MAATNLTKERGVGDVPRAIGPVGTIARLATGGGLIALNGAVPIFTLSPTEKPRIRSRNMDIWTVVAIIGGVSVCLIGHWLARRGAGRSEAEQSQSIGPGERQQPFSTGWLKEYR